MELADMDTVELREWLYSQSEDAVVATIASFTTQIANLQERLEKSYGYLSMLFKHLAPQCTPDDELIYLCTQIDNYIAGQKERLEAWRAFYKSEVSSAEFNKLRELGEVE